MILDHRGHDYPSQAVRAIPFPPEDIARVEKAIETEDVELPAKLRDPYAVFDAAERPCASVPLPPTNEDVVECLARAAREGKKISPG